MASRPPIARPVPRLRQRQRSDGSWRVWWEPKAADRAAGFAPVDLSADRPTWSAREAERLNRELATAHAGGGRRPARAAGQRTVSHLIAAYMRDTHYTVTLRPATQASYRAFFRLIEAKWGDYRAAEFDEQTMHAWYQTLYRAKGASMARAMIRHMSILLAYATKPLGWRTGANPCADLQMVTPKRRSRSASWAELDALIAAAMDLGLPSVALAIRLAVFQGQRQTDVLAARRDQFQQLPVRFEGEARATTRWVWRFTRSKRDNDGHVLLHPETIDAVRQALALDQVGDRTLTLQDALIWDERVGRPYDVFLFAKRWSAVRAAAAKAGHPALATLKYRDLRRTFGVLARMGGATADDVGDVLGNTAADDPALREIYMPPTLETASRAVSAIKRPQKQDRKQG